MFIICVWHDALNNNNSMAETLSPTLPPPDIYCRFPLSIGQKLFCKAYLTRINIAVDQHTLKTIQAGRKGKHCRVNLCIMICRFFHISSYAQSFTYRERSRDYRVCLHKWFGWKSTTCVTVGSRIPRMKYSLLSYLTRNLLNHLNHSMESPTIYNSLTYLVT